MEKIFFENWSSILRVFISTVVAYLTVILLLRIYGKRTLAKMNAFDFVVTIALGSILGAMILNKSVPLLNGLCAIITLISLQYIITFLAVRSKYFKNIINNDPSLLYYQDQFLHQTLKKERIAVEEVNKAVRESGHSNYDNVDAVVLETTGDLTVISKSNESGKSAMADII